MGRLKLKPAFYRRDTVAVAKSLLGKRLVRVERGRRLAGRIVEVEAYLGAADAAAHTFGGRRTARNEAMYLPGGHAYVFFVYGMHDCFNVVTKGKDEPEAVLVRALEPVEGVAAMKRFRRTARERDLSNGPAKLCQALRISRALNGADLSGREIFIETDLEPASGEIGASPRIGVDYAGEAAAWPLRFFLKGNPFVSKTRALRGG